MGASDNALCRELPSKDLLPRESASRGLVLLQGDLLYQQSAIPGTHTMFVILWFCLSGPSESAIPQTRFALLLHSLPKGTIRSGA